MMIVLEVPSKLEQLLQLLRSPTSLFKWQPSTQSLAINQTHCLNLCFFSVQESHESIPVINCDFSSHIQAEKHFLNYFHFNFPVGLHYT